MTMPSSPDPICLRVNEAARMLGTDSRQVQSDRLQAVRELSRRFGNAWVVLKGHQTLVGKSEGEVYVNPSGNPHLAQGDGINQIYITADQLRECRVGSARCVGFEKFSVCHGIQSVYH